MLKRRAGRRDQQRHPRLKGLSFSKMVPSLITVSATCAGLTGIRFAIDGRFEFAVGCIVIAAVLDALDGRMARLLKASSDFGAELDSLSDFVAFGVSPAVIMYFWALNGLGGVGWAIGLFYAVCMSLRLARFNSSIDKLPPYAYNYFQGVPAPAGAGIALFPLILSFETGPLPLFHPVILAGWTVAAALLLVSTLPTFSFKKFKVPSHFALPLMALAALALAGIAGRPWMTLSVILVLYMITFPISFRRYASLKAEADRLQDFDDKGNGGGEGGSPTDAENTVPFRSAK